MDTDELSNQTYKAVLITAEKFDHDLTLQFGLLASDCQNDDDYLKQANELIVQWKLDLPGSIDEIFFDKKPTTSDFRKVLLDIQKKIEKVLKKPIEKRTFEF